MGRDQSAQASADWSGPSSDALGVGPMGGRGREGQVLGVKIGAEPGPGSGGERGRRGWTAAGPRRAPGGALSTTQEPSAAIEMGPPRHPQPGEMEAGGASGGRRLQVEAYRLSWGSPERRPPSHPPREVSAKVSLETCVPRSQQWASGWGWGCVRTGNTGRAWLLREKWGSILEKVVKVSGPSGSVGGL